MTDDYCRDPEVIAQLDEHQRAVTQETTTDGPNKPGEAVR
jgi:hypothetical protein